MRKNFTAPPGPGSLTGSCLLNCRVGKHPLPTLRTRNAIVDARGRELRCDPRRVTAPGSRRGQVTGEAVSGIRPRCCCQTCGLSHYEIPIICGTQNAFSRRRSRDVQKYVQGAPSPTLSAGMLCAPCPGAQYSSPRAWKLTSASPLLDTCRATGGMHVDPSASPSAQLCATRSVPRLRADWPC